jgi:hypothetical protein
MRKYRRKTNQSYPVDDPWRALQTGGRGVGSCTSVGRGSTYRDNSIEEGRSESKSPHLKFGYFLSISQQVVSADLTKNSAIAISKS